MPPTIAASPRAAVVVVAYQPPPGLGARLAPLRPQAAELMIVNNGAPSDPIVQQAALQSGARVMQAGGNLGLAAALNLGLRSLTATCDHALLLDHDSAPAPDLLPHLLAATAQPAAQGAAALVPRIAYAHPDIRCRWPWTPPPGRWRFRFLYADRMDAPHAVDLAIGSGMLLDLSLYRRFGPFREEFFIDLVDTEYCLRARAAGAAIVAVPHAVLHHHLGQVERRQLPGLPPMYPTHHSPQRHYYLARNRVLLARQQARRFPSWFLYEMTSAVKLVIKVMLFEPGRWRKLHAMLAGTWDGLRGRTGPARRVF